MEVMRKQKLRSEHCSSVVLQYQTFETSSNKVNPAIWPVGRCDDGLGGKYFGKGIKFPNFWLRGKMTPDPEQKGSGTDAWLL